MKNNVLTIDVSCVPVLCVPNPEARANCSILVEESKNEPLYLNEIAKILIE